MKLNLGSNDDHKKGYWNVDIEHPADEIVDLRFRWPWADSSVEEIIAHDVGEHIDNPEFPGNKGKIFFLNECHRVLKPGGTLDLVVPCVMLADGRVNPGAFCDPTHVSFWTPDDKYYFCEEWNNPQDERGRLGPHYGISALFRQLQPWRLVEYGAGKDLRSKIKALLGAVK